MVNPLVSSVLAAQSCAFVGALVVSGVGAGDCQRCCAAPVLVPLGPRLLDGIAGCSARPWCNYFASWMPSLANHVNYITSAMPALANCVIYVYSIVTALANRDITFLRRLPELAF